MSEMVERAARVLHEAEMEQPQRVERVSGFYWVKLAVTGVDAGWDIAAWNGDWWEYLGDDRIWRDDPPVVGSLIPCPEEA